jgi:aarF domain-containing kinase
MEKARSTADIMPIAQVTQILAQNYGSDWQKRFKEINLYPFAAASIGQVHEAILVDGTRVAMKIQYTGISNSIDSDLDNFLFLVKMLGVFPKGLYLEEAVDVSRQELKWECDYLREASYQTRYKQATSVSKDKFYVPKIIENMSTKSILVSEFIDGIEIDSFSKDS